MSLFPQRLWIWPMWVKSDLGEHLHSHQIRLYLCLGGSRGLGFAGTDALFKTWFFSDLSLGGSSDTSWERGPHTNGVFKVLHLVIARPMWGSKSPGGKSFCHRCEPASRINSGLWWFHFPPTGESLSLCLNMRETFFQFNWWEVPLAKWDAAVTNLGTKLQVNHLPTDEPEDFL